MRVKLKEITVLRTLMQLRLLDLFSKETFRRRILQLGNIVSERTLTIEDELNNMGIYYPDNIPIATIGIESSINDIIGRVPNEYMISTMPAQVGMGSFDNHNINLIRERNRNMRDYSVYFSKLELYYCSEDVPAGRHPKTHKHLMDLNKKRNKFFK